jgi:hypothetical protein
MLDEGGEDQLMQRVGKEEPEFARAAAHRLDFCARDGHPEKINHQGRQTI